MKGIHLEGLRVLGLPERFAERYDADGADELLYMDIVASLYGRNTLDAIVTTTASNVFIPITVGGGVRSLADIQRLLRAGADKVAINTAAIRTPALITEAAHSFGSQCVVVSIEAIATGRGGYEAYTDNGREPTGREVIAWAREAAARGAGEILLTAVDREGTGRGFDTALAEAVVAAVSIPVIACGGAGSAGDVVALARDTGVDAVCAASIFHYDALSGAAVEKRGEGNTHYQQRFAATGGAILKQVVPASVRDVKRLLSEHGVPSGRPAADAAANRPEPVTSTPPRIVVIDYDRSNLFSVERALRGVGADVVVSRRRADLEGAHALVIAGVGAFAEAMASLRQHDLVAPIRRHAAAGRPVLGICLGMQLFMERGQEFGDHEGLGLVRGTVVRLDAAGPLEPGAKIPHIGWKALQRTATPSPALDDIAGEAGMYFVHSFMVRPANPGVVAATASHGGVEFAAVLQQGAVIGAQFHPERSGAVGLAFLRKFVATAAALMPA